MQISFNDRSYDFRPWSPADGVVFDRPIAFDCETTRIDEARHWQTPTYVLGAAFGGQHGVFLTRERASEFFKAHPDIPIAFHNAPFDLAVLHQLAPSLDIYGRVDRNLIWDTQLLYRLLMLGTDGHTARRSGESTLASCLERYFAIPLPKDVLDRDGDPVRLSYGKWLGRPPEEIDADYLRYLAGDVVATYRLCERLQGRLRDLARQSGSEWGFISREWLDQQIDRWGPQTHHIQLRAAIVLREITVNGLHLESSLREELRKSLQEQLKLGREALRKDGLLVGGKSSGKALQAILVREERRTGIQLPRTESGKIATSRSTLEEFADRMPFIRTLLEFRATEKLLSSFVEKLGRGVLHPSFDVLARTGRTTSFGEINAQNLPADDRIRRCVVPSPGHRFLDADYRTIEMATLAQSCQSQFSIPSAMARAINAGRDLHTLVAARVTGLDEKAVTAEERRKAKAINFGKPGGMGNTTLREYARLSYGVDLSEQEVTALSDAWLELFPEMHEFLRDDVDVPLGVARLLGLTPSAHADHTDETRFLFHPENAGREEEPHRILGMMCLRALRDPNPRTRAGTPYREPDLDFFWSRLADINMQLPEALRTDVAARRPTARLQREVTNLAGLGGVFTLTGRVRGRAGYTARRNTVFQGLAADGAKLALWSLWRSGYRIVNFIHDQVLVEIPTSDPVTQRDHARRVRQIMVEAMKAVVPDLRVEVEVSLADRWSKDAKTVVEFTQADLVAA